MITMQEVYLIIGTVCLSLLFVQAEPLILLKRFFGFKEEHYDDFSKLKKFIHSLLYCVVCSGFWIGLIVGVRYIGFTYSGLAFAAIVAIVAGITENKIQ